MSKSSPIKQPLLVRPVRPEDGPELYEIVKDPRVARTLLQQPSMEYRETDRWLNERQPGHHRLVAVRDGRLVGSVSLVQPQRPRLLHGGTLGLMVHPDHWRTGVGSTLMDAILDLADNWLNLLRVDLGLLSNNPGAAKLYQKFKFKHEGARRQAVYGDGELLDEIMMARLRDKVPSVEHGTRPEFSRRSDVTELFIRPLKIEDTDALHEIISDPAVARALIQIPSLEVADVSKKIEAGGPGLYRYAAVARHEDGSTKMVGNATIHQPQNPRQAHGAGLGLGVHPDYWGIGIGQRLMAAVLDLADNWLNLSRLELDVYTDNQGAIELYKRLGFEIEGTRRLFAYGDGRWSDAHFMGRLRAQ